MLGACRSALLPAPVAQPTLHLSPGDEIEVKFSYAEQFNELQKVRPDGKIELQIVGEVTAEGKTPAQLREELKQLYAPHIKYPQVAVIVRSMRGRRVYVGGEVMRTGFIDMPGPMTVQEAIMEVGGFREETADLEEVIIVRQKDAGRFSYKIDISALTAGGGSEAKVFYLEPRDIVLVPQKDVVNVNQWVDHYIRRILPISVGASTFVAPQSAQ